LENKRIIFLILIILVVISTGIFLWYANVSKVNSNDKNENKLEEKSITDEELKKEIGQMLMIGFRGTEINDNSDISKAIKDVKIGGVVLFDFDIPFNSYPRNIVNPEQTKKLISDMQKYSEITMFVAVDAEGGSINRLKQKYGFYPIVSEGKMGQDKTLKTVKEESIKLSEELKTAGFNMNLAPVVDVNVNPKNPIIGALGRSFSEDPDEVVSNADVFIKNHLANNIITVEKHFPGQGSALIDSHIGVADVTNTYKEEELIPYKKLNSEGLLDAVMVAHVMNKKIDANYPATMSSAFIDVILRKQIGFNGIVMSDDMQMDAITKNYGFEDSIIKFINAGGDVVSISNNTPNGYDSNLAYELRDIIFNAVKQNKIKESRITESYNRIINLKNKFKIKDS
jgi:beta-N-acetylhexosaminidase